jgi:DNA-binding transcriptional LysR family regulator
VDTLSALSAFVHAADARSFTKAGQRLGVSASAITKAIARLEDRAGVRLFHRSTRSVALTEDGESLLESCRHIVKDIEKIEERFAERGRGPSGKLSINVQIPSAYVAPVLHKFILAFPAVELDVDWGVANGRLIEGGFDVAISPAIDVDSRLMSKHLAYSKIRIVGAPSYFNRSGRPTTPSELARHVCIHHKDTTTGKPLRWPLIDNGSASIQPPVSIAVSMLGALVSLVQCGSGIACLPEFVIERQLEDGSIEHVLDEFVFGSAQYVAVWPSSRHLAPKIRVFVDFMAEHLFSEPIAPDQISEAPTTS